MGLNLSPKQFFSLSQIVAQLGGKVDGNAETPVFRVGSLANAQQGAIGFFMDAKYSAQLQNTQASAVIIKAEHAVLTPLPKIITDNPYAYFAKVSKLLNPTGIASQGIHQSAIVDVSAHIPASCSVAAHAVIAKNVQLGERVIIGAGCVIEHGVTIGDDTILDPNATVKHGTQIGSHCHLFSGCVIGNDGFGYAEQDGAWVKIPQVGRVVIGNHVDIGANTTIDRGAIDDTIIEDGVKLDNLIQIAHNCRIGAHTVIAGCTGIAGSAVIGKHCKIGGAAMILGHLNIADNVTISPGSMITRSIGKSGTYTALMPFQAHENWLKTAANIRHLSELTDKIKTLEKTVSGLTKKESEK